MQHTTLYTTLYTARSAQPGQYYVVLRLSVVNTTLRVNVCHNYDLRGNVDCHRKPRRSSHKEALTAIDGQPGFPTMATGSHDQLGGTDAATLVGPLRRPGLTGALFNEGVKLVAAVARKTMI